MKNKKIDFIVHIAKLYAIMSKTFDGGLGGIGLNDFIVLYYLSITPEKQLRRIDLAAKIGLTASGVTRLLLPMEKIGLIQKETNASDARVSLVSLTSAGETKFYEAMERMNLILDEKIDNTDDENLELFIKTIQNIGARFLWK